MVVFGLGQHFRRIINADDRRFWPALLQLLCAVAGTTAQINNACGLFKANLCNQIGRGTSALIGISQI
jgi:hypothetical protein